MENKLYLSQELINAILQYMSSKPFAEVHQLIQSILKDVQAQTNELSNEESKELH